MVEDGDERSERAGQGGRGSEVASRTLVHNKYVLLLAFDCLGKCANSVTSSL